MYVIMFCTMFTVRCFFHLPTRVLVFCSQEDDSTGNGPLHQRMAMVMVNRDGPDAGYGGGATYPSSVSTLAYLLRTHDEN